MSRAPTSTQVYPSIFHEVVEAGGGVIYLADVPWTGPSTYKRFRLFLALLKDRPGHLLHLSACHRWSAKLQGPALVCRRLAPGDNPAPVDVAPIVRALAIGKNP